MVTGLPWYVGRRLRIRGEHAAIAKEREELLEWERATAAERAVADARASIARELHDVVAHNVSVMTVQAGAARLLMPKDLDRAQEAIGAVEEAGRRALDELRHLLGVLRSNAVSDDLSPQPSLDQVPELVDQLRNAGMQISLASDVQSVLPDRVDLFGYRIVQEALTNVLKHGGRHATTEVRIVESDGHLDIEVTNTGTGTTSLPGAGQGLVGMQERAIMLGGTVEAGPRPGGGFGVRARLPIGDS
jgi:signal transduction histidine kinase